MRITKPVWIVAFAVAAFIQAFAQPSAPDTLWTRILNEATHTTRAWDLCLAPNQDIVVLGSSELENMDQPFVLRLTAQGDTVWCRHYGHSPGMLSSGICPAIDGGFFLTGGDSGGAEIRKIDENGDLVWRRWFRDPETLLDPHRICLSIEGGCAVFCERIVFSYDSPGLALLRYNETGDLLWYHTYTKSPYDTPCGIFQTPDNGYMLGARTTPDNVSNSQMYLLRVDQQGDSLWSSTLGGPGSDWAQGMNRTADGGAIFTGHYRSQGVDMQPDAFAARIDSTGSLLWQRIMGGEQWDQFFSAVELSTGSYICAGSNRSNSPPGLWLVGLTAAGDTLWNGSYLENSAAYAISNLADGSIALCGMVSRTGYGDGVVMRLAAPNVIHTFSTAFPHTFHLAQNYPNPFNNATILSFTVDHAMDVDLSILDIQGRVVTKLVRGKVLKGAHKIMFQASELTTGVYFCRLQSANRRKPLLK